ncbi:transposase [Methylobacterium radiotolerans]|uniref:transposase n=1 Tax=Methylobacterium radiotolerans TaxID=31998 RepID=UPI003CC80AA5
MEYFWLNDEQYAAISAHIPMDIRGKQRADDRKVISGIIHVLINDAGWKSATREIYGPKTTMYYRFLRWNMKGVWENIFDTLERHGGPSRDMLVENATRLVKVYRDPGSS